MSHFLSGAVAMAALSIAAVFYQFFKRSRDSFFAAFCIFFILTAVERIVSEIYAQYDEPRVIYVYILRLFAYLMLIFAILWKNTRHKKSVLD